MFGPANGGKLGYVIVDNVSWANQKAESFVNRWLHTHALFIVTCHPVFVKASDVISSVLSICYFVTVVSSSLEK